MHADPSVRRLLTDLSRGAAFGRPHTAVEVVQTHASIVFLVGDTVWKVKKPLDLGFLDYSTLDRRAQMCRLEVTLNRRLAPSVYQGVDPITEGPDGRLRVGGEGTAVEWAVRMRRLPEEATLRHAVVHDRLAPRDLEPVAVRLAAFHDEAERGPVAQAAGAYDTVARLATDNLDALDGAADVVGTAAATELRRLTEDALQRLEPTIRARAERGVPCALHGDLRLEHVYSFPDAEPPHDWVVIDGIEFSDELRHGDPVADVAFLVMDLQAYGAWPHATHLARAWADAADDPEGASLLPLYVSYRSAVRAKVATLLCGEPEVPEAHREAAAGRARRHVRLAVGALRRPEARARLLITEGLPGTGKTTLARQLAERLPLSLVHTDVTRKQLAGLAPHVSAKAAPHQGLYTADWTRRTYAACLDAARDALESGRPVLVDGNFRDPEQRVPFRELAHAMGVPFQVLHCTTPDAVLRARLRARRGDASDADESILDAVLSGYVAPSGPDVITVDMEAPDVDAVVAAVLGLHGAGARPVQA